jgi:sigma-B regulation protein RsbU (phosphoserine phosphatase)
LEHELTIAAVIQQALMPPAQHNGAGFEVAAASFPCRAIGGDFLDYFDLPSGAFGFALGDVSGKGSPAALLAAKLQGILGSYSRSASRPSEMLTHINEELARRTIESRFATLLYGVLCEGRVTYASAGHNPPLPVGHHDVRRLDRGGLILGAFPNASFDEETVPLAPGDVLVLFSDGITEALDPTGSEFGEERLLECVRAHRESPPTILLQTVLASVREFIGSDEQSDDLTALILRYTGP